MMISYKKLACFVGGLLFGSVGMKVLGSKDAKNVYVHITAAGLRAKDSVMETVTCVQEHVADIVSSAKDLNEAREMDDEDEEIITDDAFEGSSEDELPEDQED